LKKGFPLNAALNVRRLDSAGLVFEIIAVPRCSRFEFVQSIANDINYS